MTKATIGVIFGMLLSVCSQNSKAVPETIKHVDLNRYLGKWYEIASIPQYFQQKCIGNTTAEYSAAEKGYIRILNSCDTKTGERAVAEGRAKVVDLESNSKLKVTFVKFIWWLFLFGGNYWILEIGPDYSHAVIGDPSLKYAWILSRQPTMPQTDYASVEKLLKNAGYDTCAILISIQKGGNQARTPLCDYIK